MRLGYVAGIGASGMMATMSKYHEMHTALSRAKTRAEFARQRVADVERMILIAMKRDLETNSNVARFGRLAATSEYLRNPGEPLTFENDLTITIREEGGAPGEPTADFIFTVEYAIGPFAGDSAQIPSDARVRVTIGSETASVIVGDEPSAMQVAQLILGGCDAMLGRGGNSRARPKQVKLGTSGTI